MGREGRLQGSMAAVQQTISFRQIGRFAMSIQRWTILGTGLCGGILGGVLMYAGTLSPLAAADEDAGPPPASLARAAELSDAFRWVSKRTLPAIVSIRTTRRVASPRMTRGSDEFPFGRRFGGGGAEDLFEDLRRRMQEQQGQGSSGEIATGEGSGFIIRESGLIMTNAHVVRGAGEVYVGLADGREFKATDIRSDDFADVAVLRIESEDALPVVPLGDDRDVEIGDWVLAFGSPFGLDRTVTQGIISAKSRGMKNLPVRQEFLQTDAAVNPGNSGGPLVNMRGEVIGINTAIETRSGGYDGISLAIPVSLARWVSDQLLAGGRVRRAYLGVTPVELTPEIARAMKLPTTRGVVVESVRGDSPAAAAGMEPGDVIISLNGEDIRTRQQLMTIAERLPIGNSCRIVVLRDGDEKTLQITAAEFPQEMADNSAAESGSRIEELGVAVAALTPELAEQLDISIDSGLVVTDLLRGSIADRLGLVPGVVLTRIGNRDLQRVDDLRQGLQEAARRGQLVLLVSSSDGTRLLSVPFESQN